MAKLSKRWQDKSIQIWNSAKGSVNNLPERERLFIAACEGLTIMDDEHWYGMIELSKELEIEYETDRKKALMEIPKIRNVNPKQYLDAMKKLIDNP